MRYTDEYKEKHMAIKNSGHYTFKKLIIVAFIGVITGLCVAWTGWGKFALLAGWDAATLIYILWTWYTVLSLDERSTKTHAVREDPGRAAADILLVIASIASLGAVLILILDASQATGLEKVFDIIIGLISIVFSWFLVQTTFALKYARLFYSTKEKAVDFNEKALPSYSDFAYIAFTIGMTFQVSDTTIQTKVMRDTVLRHAMLSYLYGTVIIATTINTLASLSK
jgi:uncharacterized membrane protein